MRRVSCLVSLTALLIMASGSESGGPTRTGVVDETSSGNLVGTSNRPATYPGAPPPAVTPVVVRSPDGQLRVAFDLCVDAGAADAPCYDVSWQGKPVIVKAGLGFELTDEPALAENFVIADVARRQVDETYSVYPGKASRARDHYHEAVITLEERNAPGRQLQVIFRAYDDGVAVRYRFPEQPGVRALTIAEERSTFEFAGEPWAYTLPLRSFTTSYEERYVRTQLKDVAPGQLLALPLLLELPDGVWVGVTEANLTDYAGMVLTRTADRSTVLTSRLSPWPDEPRTKVRVDVPAVSPWRVLMIADDPGGLIESNLVLNLNEPSVIDDVSWIRPGKTTFPWWNGYEVGDAGFRGGLNTQTIKHYIDFCAEHGIEYHTLDGFGEAWYGGPIVPYEGADITTSTPEIDLPEVIDYARRKGVRLRLWLHWEAARAHMATAFPRYEEWGIEGVMLDFMDRDDQEMNAFLHEALRLAAKHRLTVTLHGVSKPTGLRRTYPNLLSSEAVLNLEYNKWDSLGVSPEHEVTVPFTRMLAGPLDFHQGSFRHVPPDAYTPREVGPVVRGTRARTLATYVVFENYLPMMADYPAAYRGEPGLRLLIEIPATWDETRVLNAAVGELITIARRSGQEWFVGSMTDSRAREITVPLDFAGPGRFTAEIFGDDPDASDEPSTLTFRSLEVSAADTIRAYLAPAGGHLIRLRPR